MVAISNEPLDVAAICASVAYDEAGAIDVFIGTVRNKTSGRKVLGLEFEAYEKMALLEMKKIIDSAAKQWPVLKASIVHRVGELSIGEIAVIIAVATPHREAAFQACQYMIDTLKQTVPIWKKEIFADGEVWVSAHP